MVEKYTPNFSDDRKIDNNTEQVQSIITKLSAEIIGLKARISILESEVIKLKTGG